MTTIQQGTQLRKRIRFGRLVKQSFIELRRNDPLRMAAATSFFTTFALPPILIILFQLFTLFLSRKLVGTEMTELLTATFGRESAQQIRVTTRGFRSVAQNWYVATAGFLFLLFVATTLFTVIKNTLNDIWNIKLKEKRGILFYLKLRGRSLIIIVASGILFLASIVVDSFEVFAGDYMEKILDGGGIFFRSALNEVTGAIIIAVWFVVLFRYLADGRPSWKVALAGGLLTGILFSAGKALLSFLVQNSNIGTIYGASGSLVLLLLFVFYCSFILYYGASFIKVYSDALNEPISTLHHAYHYEQVEIRDDGNKI
jgi:membrane protein